MGWLKPALFKIGIGGKDKLFTEANCPWRSDCPQFVREVKIKGVGGGPDFVRKEDREVPLPPKLLLVEQVQPHVRLYKCLYCGMKFFAEVDGRKIPEERGEVFRNPSLIGGRKGEAIFR
jgi:hypothetical protein